MSVDPELLRQVISETVKRVGSKTEADQWKLARAPLEEEIDLSKPEYEEVILQPNDVSERKKLSAFKTYTFLD
ncbi:MAG: hypothetical protein DRJ60_06860, partial [Thermoprotei archaeon]